MQQGAGESGLGQEQQCTDSSAGQFHCSSEPAWRLLGCWEVGEHPVLLCGCDVLGPALGQAAGGLDC